MTYSEMAKELDKLSPETRQAYSDWLRDETIGVCLQSIQKVAEQRKTWGASEHGTQSDFDMYVGIKHAMAAVEWLSKEALE